MARNAAPAPITPPRASFCSLSFARFPLGDGAAGRALSQPSESDHSHVHYSSRRATHHWGAADSYGPIREAGFQWNGFGVRFESGVDGLAPPLNPSSLSPLLGPVQPASSTHGRLQVLVEGDLPKISFECRGAGIRRGVLSSTTPSPPGPSRSHLLVDGALHAPAGREAHEAHRRPRSHGGYTSRHGIDKPPRGIGYHEP